MGVDDQPLAGRIVRAVTITTGTDPLDLPPLYDAVDPDALEAAVDGMDEGSVTFSYAGCSITVTDEQAIDIERGADCQQVGTVRASN